MAVNGNIWHYTVIQSYVGWLVSHVQEMLGLGRFQCAHLDVLSEIEALEVHVLVCDSQVQRFGR